MRELLEKYKLKLSDYRKWKKRQYLTKMDRNIIADKITNYEEIVSDLEKEILKQDTNLKNY